jgi:hypothetical protein
VSDWHPCHPARLLLGVHALASSVLSSLANPNGSGDSNGGRILLKPSVGIVPTVFSSNIIDNASRHRDSSVHHWEVH